MPKQDNAARKSTHKAVKTLLKERKQKRRELWREFIFTVSGTLLPLKKLYSPLQWNKFCQVKGIVQE